MTDAAHALQMLDPSITVQGHKSRRLKKALGADLPAAVGFAQPQETPPGVIKPDTPGRGAAHQDDFLAVADAARLPGLEGHPAR